MTKIQNKTSLSDKILFLYWKCMRECEDWQQLTIDSWQLTTWNKSARVNESFICPMSCWTKWNIPELFVHTGSSHALERACALLFVVELLFRFCCKCLLIMFILRYKRKTISPFPLYEGYKQGGVDKNRSLTFATPVSRSKFFALPLAPICNWCVALANDVSLNPFLYILCFAAHRFGNRRERGVLLGVAPRVKRLEWDKLWLLRLLNIIPFPKFF